jgi:macrolide transport system ATP-binding/permease protein
VGREILDLFDRLNSEGVTLIVVTHDEGVAMHAQRIVKLRDGRKVADMPTARDPATQKGYGPLANRP